MFYLRVSLSLLGFVAASVYAMALAALRRDRSRVAYDYARAMVRLMRPPLGLEVQVEGREHLMAQRPCVYIANHQSAYDVPVLAELHTPDAVIIANFFIVFGRPHYPPKLFASEQAALAWLQAEEPALAENAINAAFAAAPGAVRPNCGRASTANVPGSPTTVGLYRLIGPSPAEPVHRSIGIVD